MPNHFALRVEASFESFLTAFLIITPIYYFSDRRRDKSGPYISGNKLPEYGMNNTRTYNMRSNKMYMYCIQKRGLLPLIETRFIASLLNYSITSYKLA